MRFFTGLFYKDGFAYNVVGFAPAFRLGLCRSMSSKSIFQVCIQYAFEQTVLKINLHITLFFYKPSVLPCCICLWGNIQTEKHHVMWLIWSIPHRQQLRRSSVSCKKLTRDSTHNWLQWNLTLTLQILWCNILIRIKIHNTQVASSV